MRSWTVYVDEAFFREHMRWAIPEHAPLVQGVPPGSWDGRPLHLRPGSARLALLEPILRRMSLTIALSTSQLTRLSPRHFGATPLQMQAELRVTEFTRFIEETDLTTTEAARRVGWNDPRIATIRLQGRSGVTPSRYRKGG